MPLLRRAENFNGAPPATGRPHVFVLKFWIRLFGERHVHSQKKINAWDVRRQRSKVDRDVVLAAGRQRSTKTETTRSRLDTALAAIDYLYFT